MSSTALQIMRFPVLACRLGYSYKDVEFHFAPIASASQETTEKALKINIHFRIYLESLYAQSEKRQLSVLRNRNIDIVELSRSSFQTVF